MSQKLLIQCPTCNARLALPNSSQSEFAVGCPKCQLQFRVQNPAPLPPTQPTNQPTAPLREGSEQDHPTPNRDPSPQIAETPQQLPTVRAEAAKPAKLVQAIPVGEPGTQASKAVEPSNNAFQQPHVGATQLPIDSKGNFKGSVTKRDLPNFDFEATNAKFELHTNAPGRPSTKNEAPTEVAAPVDPPNESVSSDQSHAPTKELPEQPTEHPPTPAVERSQEKPRSATVASQSHEPKTTAPRQAPRQPSQPITKGKAAPALESPELQTPSAGDSLAAPAESRDANRVEPALPAGLQASEQTSTPTSGRSTHQSRTQTPDASVGSPSLANNPSPELRTPSPKIEESLPRLEPAPQPNGTSETQNRNQTQDQQAKATEPAEQSTAFEATPSQEKETEQERLARLAALVSKDDGKSKKGRRGKRGRRNRKKSPAANHQQQTDAPRPAPASEIGTELKPKNGKVAPASTSPSRSNADDSRVVPVVASTTAGNAQVEPLPKATGVKKTKKNSAPRSAPEDNKQDVDPVAAKPLATGTYAKQKSNKRLKKKPVNKGKGSARKPKTASASSSSPQTNRKGSEEAENSSSQDWTSYQYLAQRSESNRRKRMIVAGGLTLLALGFAIWAVVKADLFKELSRPANTTSPSEVAGKEEAVDSSHPFASLYIKILQARISSLKELSPTADAMISFRQKNPIAGDIEYLFEKALTEEPAPREARKLILSDFAKLEGQQQKLENALLKGMKPSERRKWEKWLRTDAPESAELASEMQLSFKTYCSDGLFSLPLPEQGQESLWLSLEELQTMRSYLSSLAGIDDAETANFAGTRLFKEGDGLFANALKLTEAKKSDDEVPRSYKEFAFAARMARNVMVQRLERKQLMTPTLRVSLEQMDAAHEAFRLAGLGKSEREVRKAYESNSPSVANNP